jgi:hypothetical protein
MNTLTDLLLLSGNDIPFPEARVTIHQPTLKEVAYVGEDNFFIGCGFLDFSKDLLSSSDKTNLENYNDFDIFMSIIIQNDKNTQKTIESAFLVLSLIFPLYQIGVRTDAIVLKKDEQEFTINKNNFREFKSILSQMFNLNSTQAADTNFNPVGSMSERIAEKLKKRHEQLLKVKNEKTDNKKISIFSRYISILAIGCQKNLNDLMNYTVYQLYDEFQRFQLKMQWDAYIQARMAGAQDLEEVDNWMIDIHNQDKNKNKK